MPASTHDLIMVMNIIFIKLIVQVDITRLTFIINLININAKYKYIYNYVQTMYNL